MRRHLLVLAVVGAAGLALLLSSAAATRPGVKLTATPPPVTSRTAATFKWIARPGARRTRCRLRWEALPGTRDKATALARQRAKLRRCSSPKTWTKLVRGRYTFVLIAHGRRTSTSTRYSWKVVRGSARGRQFSGTFDCYGSTPNCKRSGAKCTSTISSGLQTALNNAAGGKVICLNAGSYGDISLSSKSYASDVIVQPVAGATATIGRVTLRSVAHLRLSGRGGTLKSGSTHVSGRTSKHLTFDHIVYTSCMRFDGTASSAAILVDHDRLDNLGVGLAGCNMGEGRIQVEGSGMSKGWLVISNTHFGGGCSDGVQLGGPGAVVGPGNEFTGILQGGCGAHADAIQLYGGQNATITGNFFHGNSNGIVNNDRPAVYTVRNNVIVGPFDTGAGIAVTGGNGIQAIHNTVIWGGGNTTIGVDKVNDANLTPATNAVLTGNVTDGGHTDQCGNCTANWTYNLGTGRSGTGNLRRKPVYVSTPASGYYHYQLRSSSPGYHAATDGKSMGITP